ncbi:DNA helicase [Citrobacter phage HCF1]|uniref:Helicase n=1 Tax=Citrobacter phage HCF1 TaxID=2849700 RepID=A0ABX6D427_9CAUD|nr:DNA helicase [Citrobacter phage HCF1]
MFAHAPVKTFTNTYTTCTSIHDPTTFLRSFLRCSLMRSTSMTYANSDRKNNSELVLKARDSGHVSIARANSENNMSFVALGCMSVIAGMKRAQLEGVKKELKGERSGTELTALLESRDELEEKRKAVRYRVSGVQEALVIFGELSKTYINAANASGYAGDEAEMSKLIEIIIKLAKQNKGITNSRAIYESARKVRPFVGQAGVMKRIEEKLIPMLEDRHYVCNVGKFIYINPCLMGATEESVVLKPSRGAMRVLNIARQELEPDLADGGKYSHTMLRGALGKMDKQVIRIASVLHVIRNWFNEEGTPTKAVKLKWRQCRKHQTIGAIAAVKMHVCRCLWKLYGICDTSCQLTDNIKIVTQRNDRIAIVSAANVFNWFPKAGRLAVSVCLYSNAQR